MARGLDHIVHAVADLDATAALYRALGFQVGARNRHPRSWGTQNQLVQLPGTFIELLAVADTSGIAPHGPSHFSFGAFNRDFLDRGQGLSMLVLEGRGATDVAAFQQSGIGDFELYEFEREGQRPDGTLIKVAFALAFAADPRAPDIGFFTCLHRYPEHFWNPLFQAHANTACGVAGVVVVAENPSDHHIFLFAFTGERAVLATSSGITVKTPRGEVQVMTPTAFIEHFSVPPPAITRGARLAAIRFAVRDLGRAAAVMTEAAVNHRTHMDRLVVGPEAAVGATLAFEAAG